MFSISTANLIIHALWYILQWPYICAVLDPDEFVAKLNRIYEEIASLREGTIRYHQRCRRGVACVGHLAWEQLGEGAPASVPSNYRRCVPIILLSHVSIPFADPLIDIFDSDIHIACRDQGSIFQA